MSGIRYVLTDDQIITLMTESWKLPRLSGGGPESMQVGSPGHRLLVETGVIPGEGKRWCNHETSMGGDVYACELVEGHDGDHAMIVRYQGEAAMTDTRAVVAATLRILATERGPVSRTPEYLAELAEVVEHPKVELYCPLCREMTCLDGCPLRAERAGTS